MARNLRDIRRKRKAIKSTRQVTKAMELIAASKMRKAVQNAQRLREYAMAAWAILQRIAEVHPGAHPFLEQRPAKRVLIILITTDRALCGSLNAQVLRTLQQELNTLKTLPEFERAEFIAVGRKGQQYLARTSQQVIAAFPAMSNHPTFKDILPIVRMASEGFLDGTYDQVRVIYPSFVSALVQQPHAKTLLPFSEKTIAHHPSYIDDVHEFLFEPSQQEVLKIILPQLIEVQVFQAILEATAAEHSARMVAMRNASDNASDILDDLTLTYNQTRQANITAELAELSAAAAALG